MFPIITLPEDFLQALGTLLVRFNHLEAVLEMVQIRTMGLDDLAPRSRVPFVNMTFLQRLECLETLLSVISMERGSTEPLETFKKDIGPKLSDVNTRRNSLIHSRLGYRDGNVFAMRMQAKGKMKFSNRTVSLKEIADLNDAITAAANAVWGVGLGNYAFQRPPAKGAVSKSLQSAGKISKVFP